MPLLIADELRQLRTNCGCPATDKGPSGLSDTQLTDCLNLALKNMSRQLPIKSVAPIVSVAKTQTYDLNTITRYQSPYAIPDYVFTLYMETVANFSADAFLFDGELSAYGTGTLSAYSFDPGMSWYNNPSLFEVFIHNMKSLRRIMEVDCTYDQSTGILTIIPTPSRTGDNYWILQGYNLTLANIPATYEPPLLKLAESYVLKALAMIQQRLAGMTDAGAVVMFSNVKYLLNEARVREAEGLTMITEISHVQGLPLR